MTEEKEATEGGGEGTAEDLPGYVLTGEDQRMQNIYGDWVHSNNGAHLSTGIQDDKEWQYHWKTLVVITARRYNAPSRRVGHRLVHALAAELTGFWQHHWNTERVIFFQTVILQGSWLITKSCEIRRRVDRQLGVWEAGEHKILAEDTVRTCAQDLSNSRVGIPQSTERRYTTAWCSRESYNQRSDG